MYNRALASRGEINDEGGVLSAQIKVKFAHCIRTRLHCKEDDVAGDQHGHHFFGGAVLGPLVPLHALLPAVPLPIGRDAQLLLPPPRPLPLSHLHNSHCQG